MADYKQRPDCFDFSMDFLGDPSEILAYVEELESRAALAEPEPEGPSDEELTQFLFESFKGPIEFLCDAEEEAHLMIRSHVKFARAVLARWGNL
jgi:hypothetical protein